MKLNELRAAMREHGMDAIFVTDELNQRYLLEYPFTDGLLVITEKEAYMVTDFRYEEEAKKHADPAFTVVCPQVRTAFITEVLEKNGVKTVGYENRTMTVAEFDSYKERFGSFSFVPVGDTIETMRQVKTPEEVKLMQKAQDITDGAFAELLKYLTPNMTEIDVALELEYRMRKLGADGLAFDTIAVSGDASALPHGHPRMEKLHHGFLTMDFGAKYQGYCSDMTRTVVIGRADAEMRRLYETVLAAQKAGIDAIRAGADCATTDAAARDFIESAGYHGCFGHSLGHGVGLYIHEEPRLSSRAGGRTLKAGNVVTSEPGIYINGLYGCRIEDMLLVTEDGSYDFTHSPKELIEI